MSSLLEKQPHSVYCILTGNLKNKQCISKYNIDNPQSQVVLQNAIYKKQNVNLTFQQKTLALFYQKSYSSKQLENAILAYTKLLPKSEDHVKQYKDKANQKRQLFIKKFNVSNQQAFGCCLALSYYTGVYSQRVNRQTNIIVRSKTVNINQKIQSITTYQSMLVIVYWLMKALSYIPLHWGQVKRYVQLTQQQQKSYQQGNIATWIQFSSSSYGEPTDYFKKRNTLFIIYSISGRCIQQFSNYGNQTQVLFKPYTHFLVYKTQKKNNQLYVYMRQIFFGQSTHNLLWVDDNIFDKYWENKILMQRAALHNPLLSIVPKISTEAAMAFINSALGENRKKQNFKIITDMNRTNEKQSSNAGARFIKKIQKIYPSINILVYTSNAQFANNQIYKKLNITHKNITISVKSVDAQKFLGISNY